MFEQLSLNDCSSPTCSVLNQECIFDQTIILKQKWAQAILKANLLGLSDPVGRGGVGNLDLTCPGGSDAMCGRHQLWGELSAQVADSGGLDYICDVLRGSSITWGGAWVARIDWGRAAWPAQTGWGWVTWSPQSRLGTGQWVAWGYDSNKQCMLRSCGWGVPRGILFKWYKCSNF